MKTTIVGLGLIGGSIAIDLRKAGFVNELVGVELNPQHAAKAVDLGIVDQIQSPDEAFSTADLIILAVPVSALTKQLSHILDVVKR